MMTSREDGRYMSSDTESKNTQDYHALKTNNLKIKTMEKSFFITYLHVLFMVFLILWWMLALSGVPEFGNWNAEIFLFLCIVVTYLYWVLFKKKIKKILNSIGEFPTLH